MKNLGTWSDLFICPRALPDYLTTIGALGNSTKSILSTKLNGYRPCVCNTRALWLSTVERSKQEISAAAAEDSPNTSVT